MMNSEYFLAILYGSLEGKFLSNFIKSLDSKKDCILTKIAENCFKDEFIKSAKTFKDKEHYMFLPATQKRYNEELVNYMCSKIKKIVSLLTEE